MGQFVSARDYLHHVLPIDTITMEAAQFDVLTTVFVLICAMLVFFMQCGFAFFNSGFIQAKNCLTTLAEGLADFSLGVLVYFVFGYAIMYHGDASILDLCFLHKAESRHEGVPVLVDWFFQATFCVTTATIVSGALAERIRFGPYLLLSVMICGFIYPITGSWTWGGGFIQEMGFVDLAGSSQVHLVGGVISLVGLTQLGYRQRKYGAYGRPRIIAGHSMPLAHLGYFILWFGWYGFNLGSLMNVHDVETMGRVAVNTFLGGATASVFAMLISWIKFGKPDISIMMNGGLAGLVGITGGCHIIQPVEACMIGLVAAGIVIIFVPLLDRYKIDDPVGAIIVHGLGGLWGIIAIGLFANPELIDSDTISAGLFYGGGIKLLAVQLTGAIVLMVSVGLMSFCAFKVIQKLIGLRVSYEGELKGMDLDEFGVEAYHDFQIFSH
jgi:Amt family ammonium transporter